MPENDKIDLFFSRAYEKDLDKLIRDDINYIIPYEQLNNYVKKIISIPYNEYIEYIRNHHSILKVEKNDITQCSAFSACEVEMCDALLRVDNPGLDYIEIGRLFPQYVSHPNDIAYRKYGENQIKTSAQLGLVYEYYKYWYLSCIGYIYPKLQKSDRMKLLARTILRTPLYSKMIVDLLDKDIESTKYMQNLSKATQLRREGCVCKLLDICINECRNEGIILHHVIRPSGSKHYSVLYDMYSDKLNLKIAEPADDTYTLQLCLSNYTKKIMNMRQARIHGEVILAKPVLLLAIINGIEEGYILHNMVYLNNRLEQLYETLMLKYTQGSIFKSFSPISTPFWHLQSDGFWHLHYINQPKKTIYSPSSKWLNDNVEYAFFDESLWQLLKDEEWRTKLREFIVEKKLSITDSLQTCEETKQESIHIDDTDNTYEDLDIEYVSVYPSEKVIETNVISSKNNSIENIDGIPWTVNEEKTLIYFYKQGLLVASLAKLLNRTKQDIRFRLEKLGLKEYIIEQDESPNYIVSKINECSKSDKNHTKNTKNIDYTFNVKTDETCDSNNIKKLKVDIKEAEFKDNLKGTFEQSIKIHNNVLDSSHENEETNLQERKTRFNLATDMWAKFMTLGAGYLYRIYKDMGRLGLLSAEDQETVRTCSLSISKGYLSNRQVTCLVQIFERLEKETDYIIPEK